LHVLAFGKRWSQTDRTASAPHRAGLFRAGGMGHRRPATAVFEASERHHRRIGLCKKISGDSDLHV